MIDNILLIVVAFLRLAADMAATGAVLWVAGLVWVALAPHRGYKRVCNAGVWS